MTTPEERFQALERQDFPALQDEEKESISQQIFVDTIDNLEAAIKTAHRRAFQNSTVENFTGGEVADMQVLFNALAQAILRVFDAGFNTVGPRVCQLCFDELRVRGMEDRIILRLIRVSVDEVLVNLSGMMEEM